MAIFDFFRRRSSSPVDLRESLLRAAEEKDWKALGSLCQRHQQQIRESFPLWRQVPESIRKDATLQRRYCAGLLAVAQIFEQSGDSSLIAWLAGNAEENPMSAWRRDLEAAQSLIDRGQPGEAIALLHSSLGKNESLRGSGADHFLPRTYGMLGVAYFRDGNRANAVEFTEKAKALCAALGDEEGVRVYGANLKHMQEGATVVFRSDNGRQISREELAGVTGTFRYEIIGHTDVVPEAEALHQRARQAGSAGDYAKAVSDLERASELAPEWPYPVYDLAFTYLLMKDFEKATAYYRKTVDLAPRGFFGAITALDTLVREQKGEFPVGTYLAYLSLEWMRDPAEKSKAVHELVARLPDFAPAWKELAVLCQDDGDTLQAIENGLAAAPDPETRGILTINKALVLHRQGNRDAAVQLLGGLAVDPASTFGTEHLAKVALANLGQK